MHRRAFLTSAAAGALSALTACSGSTAVTPSIAPVTTPSRTTAPSPPSATAVPSSFALQPRWPVFGTSDSVTALRTHYLCGSTVVDGEDGARWTVSTGHWPVVVDLQDPENPTTWALLPDGDDAWTTRTVQAADSSATPAASAAPSVLASPRYSLTAGPALLDDGYAYLTVGTAAKESRCPVDLVKVDLSDGTVAASTRLSSAFTTHKIKHDLSLSFTEDRSALLIAGDGPISSSTDPDAKNIGLRLSAADLSVQLDAATVLAEPRSVKMCGEALTATYEDDEVIVYLADGTIEPLDSTRPKTVRDGRLYYYNRTDHSVLAYDPRTGETITISETGGYETFDSLSNGTNDHIHTDQHEVILGATIYDEPSFSVWRPGETSPAVSWEAAEQTIPEAACVFGEVLYTTSRDDNGTLRLTSLTSGESVGEVPGAAQQWNGAVTLAVCAWGLAASGVFYPATEWLSP